MSFANHRLLKQAISEMELGNLREIKRMVDSMILQHSKSSISTRGAMRHLENNKIKKVDSVLVSLLDEDWSSFYQDSDSENTDCYVYLHGRPMSARRKYYPLGVETFEKPFYVGMGRGGRAFSKKRSQVHAAILSSVASGSEGEYSYVHIIKDGMSEAQARELEAKLIVFFGILPSDYDKKATWVKTRRDLSLPNASLVNVRYEPTPDEWDCVKF